MADAKISALPAATLPLAGTEVLPIVQGGTTDKVAVDDLTVKNIRSNATTGVLQVAGPGTGTTRVMTVPNANFTAARTDAAQTFTGDQAVTGRITSTVADAAPALVANATNGNVRILPYQDGTLYSVIIAYSAGYAGYGPLSLDASTLRLCTSSTPRVTISSGGDATLNTGNLIQGTAAKGVNFTANTPAAGMTSQLLNWYEEGTWTPNQGSGLTVVGAFSSTGGYTRIGRQVTVSGTVTGATSVAVTAAGIVTTNLPFTVVTAGHGNATNAAVNASAAVICTTTNVTSASAIAATGTITFSATYFV